MSKHLNIYGKDKKYRQVELEFPVAEQSSTLHRPSTDEAEEIKTTYESKKEHLDIWKATYVMKFLCDEPILRDADDVELYNEVYNLELPDRNAILDMWEYLQGNLPDTMKDIMATQVFRELQKKKKD